MLDNIYGWYSSSYIKLTHSYTICDFACTQVFERTVYSIYTIYNIIYLNTKQVQLQRSITFLYFYIDNNFLFSKDR
jgi:hypothetical protein